MEFKYLRMTSEYIEDAEALSEECGIFNSGKSLEVVVTVDDDVVGCLWVYNDDDIFDFDICVDEEYRGIGVASNLVSTYVLNKINTLRKELPNITVSVEVVNPEMGSILLKNGFYEINKVGNMSIMSI